MNTSQPIQHDFISDYIASEEAVAKAISNLSQGHKKEKEYVKSSKQVFGPSPVSNRKMLEFAQLAINKMIQYRLKKLN